MHHTTRPSFSISRILVVTALFVLTTSAVLSAKNYRVATFSADVTVPLGHALHGGAIKPAEKIVDPLFARGLVLLGAGKPIVFAAIDWIEVRNDAYDRWRDALADAAGTTRERVLFASVHQHDSPLADLEAQRLLDAHGLKNAMLDVAFYERSVNRVAKSLRNALPKARTITHFGIGQAKIDNLVSNRRVVQEGRVTFARGSTTPNPELRAQPPGEIDPWIKTLSFWNGRRAVASIHCFATHPMSYYGRGGVSADFVGMARSRRQKDDPDVFQIYFSGCSGDITVGKYNDGATKNRPVFADRLYRGMVAAWKNTKRYPIAEVSLRNTPLRIRPRTTPGFTVEDMKKTLADGSKKTFQRVLAAMGLSWHKRCSAGQPIDVPVVDFGRAQFLLMPAETFVGYQLFAQQTRPDCFVMVAGYGECAPGYIPTAQATAERFNDTHFWCWVMPGVDQPMKAVIRKALQARE